MTALTCPVCGRVFHRCPSELQGVHVSYCSRECVVKADGYRKRYHPPRVFYAKQLMTELCPYRNNLMVNCMTCRWYDRAHDACYMDLPIVQAAMIGGRG